MAATGTDLRARRRARTRAEVEQAAIRLFIERGYDETTVEDIAEAALMSPRTFFRHFASKEDVLFDRQRRELAAIAEVLGERPCDEPVAESLRHMVGRLLTEEHWGAYGTDEVRAVLRLVQRTPTLAAGYLRLLGNLESVLRERVADRLGVAAADRRARLVAAALTAALRISMEEFAADDDVDLPELVADNVRLLGAGLVG